MFVAIWILVIVQFTSPEEIEWTSIQYIENNESAFDIPKK